MKASLHDPAAVTGPAPKSTVPAKYPTTQALRLGSTTAATSEMYVFPLM
jgi:hypothetical protein